MPVILTYLAGGTETTAMARLLGNDAHLVSYGAMSKQPLSLPVSLFIFKNLICHGYWLRRWYSESTLEDRENLMAELVNLMKEKKVTSIILVFHIPFLPFSASGPRT
jgi:trans-2-enoyl-CoA reductase